MAKDLVVFGEDWGSLPSSTQHLIRQLALRGERKVLWVNSIGLRRPKLNKNDLARLWHKLTARTAHEPSDTTLSMPGCFRVINPKTLPVPEGRFLRRLAAKLLVWQIKPVMASMQLRQPILWMSLPTAVDVAGRLGESKLVYYCGDDFSALAGVDHQIVARRECQLALQADLILAASHVLYRKFPWNKTKLLSHGVDYHLFSGPCQRAVDLPQGGKPIAGFYGSLSDWLDLELLEQVIQALPDWHFVFIGRQDVDCSVLSRYPHVHFLGPRPHARLPSYVQHWTVSLLPFIDSPQIRACNPLKLREYLAAGRPVVSTRFPAASEYWQMISLIDNAEQMVMAMRHAQQQAEPVRGQEAVANESWQAKAELLEQYLEVL